MKLLSAQQIHEWDAYTIEHEPIASIDLMERAARTCTDFIIDNNLLNRNIKIFCGKGNNGGDGLAIARQLLEAGISPAVYILEFGAKGTDDFQINLHKLHQLTAEIYFIQSADFFPEIDKNNDLVIDALFGSGLNRPLQDLSAALVTHINNTQAYIIAIDTPSGMFIDKSSKDNPVIKATCTLTFQALKLCFMVAENAALSGEVHVLDIGLHTDFLNTLNAYSLVTKRSIQRHYKKRNSFAHKGNFGHALLIAGNKGKMGAAILASHACLRTGAGLVTINTPEKYLNTVHTALPEVMCITRDEHIDYSKYNVLGIGPGLGTQEDSAALILQSIQNFSRPMVIDADALNILAQHPAWLHNICSGSVLTPHPKEFERLFGKTENDFEKIEKAVSLSEQYKLIIILKGHYTLIAANGTAWFNTTGNAGMAKGGSGDVLTGIITSLLAQQYESDTAAIMGVYLHGLAADIAAQNIAMESIIATDIIDHISDAFLSLDENAE